MIRVGIRNPFGFYFQKMAVTAVDLVRALVLAAERAAALASICREVRCIKRVKLCPSSVGPSPADRQDPEIVRLTTEEKVERDKGSEKVRTHRG